VRACAPPAWSVLIWPIAPRGGRCVVRGGGNGARRATGRMRGGPERFADVRTSGVVCADLANRSNACVVEILACGGRRRSQQDRQPPMPWCGGGRARVAGPGDSWCADQTAGGKIKPTDRTRSGQAGCKRSGAQAAAGVPVGATRARTCGVWHGRLLRCTNERRPWQRCSGWLEGWMAQCGCA
jgi:hypothetical protein